jgi:chaperone required for assembly of F1-ATPase
MQDDDTNDGMPTHGKPIDPTAMARRDLKKAFPKRFYKSAKADARDGGFAVLLDGKPVKTPAKNALALPTKAAAEAVAIEWQAQEEYIDPGMMPLTRLVHSALDGVAREQKACIDEIAKYAGTDLVCYRAREPDALVKAQEEAWDPYLTFAREKLGASFICTEGIIFKPQPEEACRAVHKAVQAIAAPRASGIFALAALNVMTSITGSALIALGVAQQAFSVEAAWNAAHADEDFQMQIWGHDEQALQRRARRWIEMEAAAGLFRLVHNEETIG